MKLEIKNLSKNYGRKQALNNLSVTLTEGIYGLLGSNGAGKSTTMNILTSNLKQTSGQIYFNGIDIRKIGNKFYEKVGYMPQQQAFYPDFTVQQFMDYVSFLKGMKKTYAKERIDWSLKLVSLDDMRKKKIKGLSGGMKQRLLLAQAIVADPDIIILDEPTAGLDPKQRIAVRNIVSQIAMNKIVILSTHVVPDIEFIAKEVMLLDDGKLITKAPAEELINKIKPYVWEIELSKEEVDSLKMNGEISNISRKNGNVVVRIISKNEVKPHNNAVHDLPNLEDVYLYHFGNEEEI